MYILQSLYLYIACSACSCTRGCWLRGLRGASYSALERIHAVHGAVYGVSYGVRCCPSYVPTLPHDRICNRRHSPIRLSGLRQRHRTIGGHIKCTSLNIGPCRQAQRFGSVVQVKVTALVRLARVSMFYSVCFGSYFFCARSSKRTALLTFDIDMIPHL